MKLRIKYLKVDPIRGKGIGFIFSTGESNVIMAISLVCVDFSIKKHTKKKNLKRKTIVKN